jgi:hypothetical protein
VHIAWRRIAHYYDQKTHAELLNRKKLSPTYQKKATNGRNIASKIWAKPTCKPVGAVSHQPSSVDEVASRLSPQATRAAAGKACGYAPTLHERGNFD